MILAFTNDQFTIIGFFCLLALFGIRWLQNRRNKPATKAQ